MRLKKYLMNQIRFKIMKILYKKNKFKINNKIYNKKMVIKMIYHFFKI